MKTRWVMAIGLLVLSAGCATLSYYRDAAVGQARILAMRRDVADVLGDPGTPSTTAANLARAGSYLAFAEDHLALDVGDRYRSYVELERDFLVWNVFAAPEFSVTAHEWCYPIVGCAVYKGFFEEGKARREADELEARGFDVYVGGVAAYSTLGWFDDPLVSTFIDWPDERLAGLLFHELAHSELFVPGDSAFNEAFGSFVGREGVVQWLRTEGRDAQPHLASERARQALFGLVRRWQKRLGELYDEPLADDQRRVLKEDLFDALRGCYVKNRDRLGRGAYDGYMAQPFNNARLVTVGTYQDWVGAFAALYARSGRDWEIFFARAAELAALDATPRAEALEGLAEESEAQSGDDEHAEEIEC